MSWTWQDRQLATAEKDGTTLNYTYDSEGIRTSKTVGSTTTKYLLNGTQILAQTTNGTTLSFFYDQQGNRVGMADGSNHFYYYIYNLQGDVIALADASTGKLAATYTYDAWGKCTVTNATGFTIGTDNPFRYRGYYYDSETGLYYLQSRYYDPDTGRFINEDVFVTTDYINSLGSNLFAYCNNNPINSVDKYGMYTFLCREDEKNTKATQKYNKDTVNVYVEGEGEKQDDQVNAKFYTSSQSTSEYMNINVDKSKNISSVCEINAVIDVICDSEYYDEDVYGSRSFMRGEWIAHNFAPTVASWGDIGYRTVRWLSKSENPIESAAELDLRPKDNMGITHRATYEILGMLTS